LLYKKMMRDRGYIIPQEFDKETMTKEVFLARYANNEEGAVERELLKMRFVHQTERHKILVMFEQNPKVGKKEVERLCERMGEDKRCVLILDGGVSAAAKIQIESMNPAIAIEIFREEQLLVNITVRKRRSQSDELLVL
jgi:DNA-directed RNA polymerase I, II, and III subunit RPABC1